MKQYGFSFIELLFALVIFSLSLLASMSMQIRSNRLNQSNYWQALALEQIEFAAHSLVVGDNNQFLGPWQRRVAKQLPQGRAILQCRQDQCKIEIRWWDRVAHQTAKLDYLCQI